MSSISLRSPSTRLYLLPAAPTANRFNAVGRFLQWRIRWRVKIFNFVHFSLNQSQAITCNAEVIIQELTHKILLMAILHAA